MVPGTVRHNFAMPETSGKFGLEIEMEMKVPSYVVQDAVGSNVNQRWRFEEDGSLKVNGIEWVLRQPRNLQALTNSIQTLSSFLNDNNYGWYDNVRAGVHIHLNAQEWSMQKLARFLFVYYSVETVLVASCGEGRSGNNFCLRARDASYIHECLSQFVRGDGYVYRTDSVRYSALNLKPLYYYGSVEFRALRTPQNLDDILKFVDLLTRIEKYSETFVDPWHLAANLSGNGAAKYLQDIFGDKASSLWYVGAERDIYTDMRGLQMAMHFYKENIEDVSVSV